MKVFCLMNVPFFPNEWDDDSDGLMDGWMGFLREVYDSDFFFSGLS